jgi:hypothetical protein
VEIDVGNPQQWDAFAEFGLELALLEDPSLRAREIPIKQLVVKAQDWFARESTVLHQLLCTPTNQVRPELTSGLTLAGLVASAIRAHYGHTFPAPSAASCLGSYGLAKFCAASPPATLLEKSRG